MLLRHLGHRERGCTTDSPEGQRLMQTLQKLPITAPRIKEAIVNAPCIGSKNSGVDMVFPSFCACGKQVYGFVNRSRKLSKFVWHAVGVCAGRKPGDK